MSKIGGSGGQTTGTFGGGQTPIRGGQTPITGGQTRFDNSKYKGAHDGTGYCPKTLYKG